MAYICDLGAGQRLYLNTQGTQTIVTIASSSVGQQQQSSSSLKTGAWSSPPEVYRTFEGIVVKLQTTHGTQFIQIQGSQIGLSTHAPSFNRAEPLSMQQTPNSPASTMPPMEPMQPMKPMEPMKPMRMGNMEMSLNPMEMRMGNRSMKMGATFEGSATSFIPNSTRQFCSQCGVSVKPSDRFCASCGHRLSD
jgi:hypothetical protein